MSQALNKKVEILGVGAPALDSILNVSDAYVDSLPGKRYGMQIVDYETFQTIVSASGSKPVYVLGGSACNTLKGLTQLGRRCALIGMIGKDAAGEQVKEKIAQNGMESYCIESDTVHTAQIACLVAPDGKRTMRSFLGASLQMRAQDLQPIDFQGVQLTHVEGYSLVNGLLPARAMKLAKESGARVSFDLSSFEIVDQYRAMILALLHSYVDVVFANEDEVRFFLNKGPEEGCDELRQYVDVAVVMMGARGCWVGDKETVQYSCAYPKVPLDTTGAGDLFASGFLHGYLKDCPLDVCAHYGALTGAAVVEVSGTDISIETWDQIRARIG